MSAHSDKPFIPVNDAGADTGSALSRNGTTDSSDTIEDVQGWRDNRRISINWVGVRDVRHPLLVRDRSDNAQHVTATVGMFVGLAADRKGTHMSRFIEMLCERGNNELNLTALRSLLRHMVERLDASSGRIDIAFTWFKQKNAPVSGVPSLCSYDVRLAGEIHQGQIDTHLEVIVPVTSLCPCSKEISDYGAHNQRSHVTVRVSTDGILFIDELIERVEAEASSELYGVLKRADEKFVTERAYDNPKFVEDIVRDVAGTLKDDSRITSWTVTCENFESIHNHSAWATISSH